MEEYDENIQHLYFLRKSMCRYFFWLRFGVIKNK